MLRSKMKPFANFCLPVNKLTTSVIWLRREPYRRARMHSGRLIFSMLRSKMKPFANFCLPVNTLTASVIWLRREPYKRARKRPPR